MKFNFVLLAILGLASAGPVSVKKNAQKAGYRLPTNLVPENYNVFLVPYLVGEGDKEFTFEGVTTIRVKVDKPTDVITLHSHELTIMEPSTRVHRVPPDVNLIRVIKHDFEATYQFMHITLDQELEQDKPYDITFSFTGKLNSEMSGFYRSSYRQDNETKWMATTQFQPTSARKAFPCFDEPKWKATFNINIARTTDLHVLGNMPLKMTSKPDENIGGRVWDTFQETPIMSPYLVAFIVSDFDSYTYNDFLSIWARKNSIHQGAYALQIAPKVWRALEEFTGLPYTLPKLDNVAISDFSAGAMENWGLLTYRETALLYDPIESTENNKQRVATVLAHEIAHMWFGDLVTLEWWSYTWLNEGFARYLQYIATDVAHPDWNLMHQFVVDHLQTIFRTDSLVSSQPLTKDCETPAEISSMFGSISYSKGAAILRMIDHILSRDTFRKALHNYLLEHEYSTVTPTLLFKSLDEQAVLDDALPEGITIDESMRSWTEKSGYPVITVTRDHADMNRIKLSQAQFLLNASPAEETLWWIPLSWTKESDIGNEAFEDTKPSDWIRGVKEVTLDIPTEHTEWVIFNNQQTGYYRVAYDAEVAWPLIIAALQSTKYENIHVLNRAQIIDDALNLARGDIGTYENALEATLYLKNEVEYIPWVAAFNGFSYLETRLNSLAGFEAFKMYVLQSLDKLYNTVTFEETIQEDQSTIFNRINVLSWACKYGHTDCSLNAKKEFEKLVEKNVMVAANKKSVVYCTALREGSTVDWTFMWNKYLNSDLATEQVLILSALGCTNSPTQLQQYLMKSIDEFSGIRKQDAPSVFSSVYNNPAGVDIAFDFLINNFGEITSFYVGTSAIINAITGVASKLTTREQVDKLIKFIEDNANDVDESVAIAGERAIEAAEADLAWSLKNAATILQWMQEKTYSNDAPGMKASSIVLSGAAILSVLHKIAFQTR